MHCTMYVHKCTCTHMYTHVTHKHTYMYIHLPRSCDCEETIAVTLTTTQGYDTKHSLLTCGGPTLRFSDKRLSEIMLPYTLKVRLKREEH